METELSLQKCLMLNLKTVPACMPSNHNKIKCVRYFPGIFPLCQIRNKDAWEYFFALTHPWLISAAIFNDLCDGKKSEAIYQVLGHELASTHVVSHTLN